jgi:dimethylamine/trimethylamine dehydrogenase
LWDINISDYSLEMGVSRFVKEGALESYMASAKSKTTKPVVTVGRFTSPDTMVSQIKRGITDFIGAARPSIADPFIPNKIAEGRVEDIRECIGCNICYTGDQRHYPIRCTQNPTMGEEWRREWHPEKIQAKGSDDLVLVVGAGPAGLEAARALGQRGYDVILAEANSELGGRVTTESRLPGLAEWARVRDYRLGQFNRLPNVQIYRESKLSLNDILDVGAAHVAIATGSEWRRDGFGCSRTELFDPPPPADRTFTPDDIMAGRLPKGSVLVFDDDGFYMASVIAEKLAASNHSVYYLTARCMVSYWSNNNQEQERVHRRLAGLGVHIVLNQALDSFNGRTAVSHCVYTEKEQQIEVDNVVLVTCRTPRDGLYHELLEAIEQGREGAPKTVQCIGDADAPAIIAQAVYAGHKYARELDCVVERDVPPRVDRGTIIPVDELSPL